MPATPLNVLLQLAGLHRHVLAAIDSAGSRVQRDSGPWFSHCSSYWVLWLGARSVSRIDALRFSRFRFLRGGAAPSPFYKSASSLAEDGRHTTFFHMAD